ncbi:ECF transporter S component [Lactovum odontotermitis]
MKNKKSSSASSIAMLAIFIAVMIVVQLLTQIVYGIWPIPVQPTLMGVPVIIGSIILGPRMGAFLGFFMGLYSFVYSSLFPIVTSYWFTPLQPHGNFWSLVIAFLPRVLVGIIPYYVYQIFKNRLGAGLAGFAGAATNTVLVLGIAALAFQTTNAGVLGATFQQMVALIVGANSIAEAVAAIIIAAAIVPILEKIRD